MLLMSPGMEYGEMRPGPFSSCVCFARSSVARPPMPEPMKQPARFFSSSVARESPASSTAILAAPSASSMKRSISFSFFFSMKRSGSQLFTSPAIFDAEERGIEQRDEPDAALCRKRALQVSSTTDAEGSDEPDAGDDDACRDERRTTEFFLAFFSM